MNEPLFSAFKPGELPIQDETKQDEVIVDETKVDDAKTDDTITNNDSEAGKVDEAPKPTIVEVEKIVEKIVEKYPEMDEHTSAIFTALMEGKEDELLSYLSEKKRNYGEMSDYDVIKANLKRSNPNWSNDDVDVKMEVQYGELVKINLSTIDKETNPEEYADAEIHNRTVDRNLKLLRLDRLDAQAALEAAKPKEIKLPKIDQPPVDNTPSPEALEKAKKDWTEIVDKEIPLVKEFTFKAGNKEIGYEDVSYVVTDDERKKEYEFFKELNPKSLFERLGWVDATGKQNVQKMAGDVLKLERIEKIAASAYTAGHTAGTKGTVAEIKNLDLGNKAATSVSTAKFDIGLSSFGHLNPK